ncbi:hypothetical protein BCR42DRAFT_413020 [Absidia repens]|uniref:Uncharacterized protein n=1 Tax=Absidia repens TaxID=90262 RepID=A0A1X2IKH1_9FUNG|nr:hypothetical protein BCR42DRAFT_413020 [Absidia repens]
MSCGADPNIVMTVNSSHPTSLPRDICHLFFLFHFTDNYWQLSFCMNADDMAFKCGSRLYTKFCTARAHIARWCILYIAEILLMQYDLNACLFGFASLTNTMSKNYPFQHTLQYSTVIKHMLFEFLISSQRHPLAVSIPLEICSKINSVSEMIICFRKEKRGGTNR